MAGDLIRIKLYSQCEIRVCAKLVCQVGYKLPGYELFTDLPDEVVSQCSGTSDSLLELPIPDNACRSHDGRSFTISYQVVVTVNRQDTSALFDISIIN